MDAKKCNVAVFLLVFSIFWISNDAMANVL